MITLENLKADEANILAQLSQVQGALGYNRQMQAFLAKQQEEQKPENEKPPAEPASPIR